MSEGGNLWQTIKSWFVKDDDSAEAMEEVDLMINEMQDAIEKEAVMLTCLVEYNAMHFAITQYHEETGALNKTLINRDASVESMQTTKPSNMNNAMTNKTSRNNRH